MIAASTAPLSRAASGRRRPLRRQRRRPDRPDRAVPDDGQPSLPRDAIGGRYLGRGVGRGGRADPPGERLRSRPARAAPRGSPARADRPGANRLSVDLDVRDVDDSELMPAVGPWPAQCVRRGEEAVANGEAAVVTLAAGRRQPLDHRRRGRQGGQPVRPARRLRTAASWRSTWPRPGSSRRPWASPSPTS